MLSIKVLVIPFYLLFSSVAEISFNEEIKRLEKKETLTRTDIKNLVIKSKVCSIFITVILIKKSGKVITTLPPLPFYFLPDAQKRIKKSFVVVKKYC